MSPPPCHGGIASSSASRAVEHADAGGAVELVGGEGVEVRVQRPHVDLRVRHGLRAIHQHQRAARMGRVDDALDRQDGAERIRDMRDADELRAWRQQLLELLDAAARRAGRSARP